MKLNSWANLSFENILPQLVIQCMLTCTHVIQLLLHHGRIIVSAPISLYRYFKPMSKSLPDPEGQLSEAMPSATIEAANETVLAAGFKITHV